MAINSNPYQTNVEFVYQSREVKCRLETKFCGSVVLLNIIS